jgi:hypothetical protein
MERTERNEVLGRLLAKELEEDGKVVAGVGLGVQLDFPLYPYGVIACLGREGLREESGAEAGDSATSR